MAVKKIYQKSKFAASRAAEKQFERSLAKVARESARIVSRFTKNGEVDLVRMTQALANYAEKIEPWARSTTGRMLKETVKRVQSDSRYKELSKRIGLKLSNDIFNSDIGLLAYTLQTSQVELIKSIPTDAGLRVQKLASEAVANGTRATTLAKQISQTLEVSENKAKLIARTEVARSNTMLNLARAKSVGSEKYIWRNSGDGAVRPSHNKYKGKKLDGLEFYWDAPPTLDDGMTGHAGTFPNCRCYAEPILPDL